jgi:hypothetical protein
VPRAAVVFDCAIPLRARGVDRAQVQTVPGSVLDDRRRMVEAHRLVVERRGREMRPDNGFSDTRSHAPAARTAPRATPESLERKRRDRLHDRVLLLARDPARCHGAPQHRLEIGMQAIGRLAPVAPLRYGWTILPTIGPGRMIATCTTRS